MDATWKKVGAIVIIVGGIGISAYMWTEYGLGKPETDVTADARNLSYVCEKCGQSFTVTVAESREAARSGTKLTCPSCGEAEVKSAAAPAGMFWKPPENFDPEKEYKFDGGKPVPSPPGRKKIE